MSYNCDYCLSLTQNSNEVMWVRIFSLEKSVQGWLKEKTKHTYLGLCLFEIEWDNWKKKNVGISPILYLSHCLVCDLFYYQGNEN